MIMLNTAVAIAAVCMALGLVMTFAPEFSSDVALAVIATPPAPARIPDLVGVPDA
jgi:hypothetical protein